MTTDLPAHKPSKKYGQGSRGAQPEKQGRINKRCLLIDSNTKMHQCRSISKDLYRSTLCGHWMQPKGLVKTMDDRYR